MAKPIFIIEVPKSISKEQLEVIKQTVKKEFPDYNTLGVVNNNSDSFKYTVLNNIDKSS